MRTSILGFLLLWLPALVTAQSDFPLAAHSHNDYAQERPLFLALSQGFASVEVDIHLVDGQLLVAHDADQVVTGRSLTTLYLEPIRLLTQVYGGRVYPDTDTPLILLVDIKSEAEATYRQLQRVLAPYEPLLTRFTASGTEPGAVTVIISGNRPRDLMAGESPRFAGYDGRLADLDPQLTADRHFMPMVSGNWSQTFTWDGTGAMPTEEFSRLRSLCQVARDAGILLRFWGIPDQPSVWGALRNAGIGVIGTDRVEALGYFLRY
jgi:glycerophosphoryl diester phosphodiesterase